MKRTSRARFVGIGIERPEVVDRMRNWGKVYSKQEIIQRQLNGEPIPLGESSGRWGYALEKELTEREPA